MIVTSRQLSNHTQPKYCHDHTGDGSRSTQELTPMLLIVNELYAATMHVSYNIHWI